MYFVVISWAGGRPTVKLLSTKEKALDYADFLISEDSIDPEDITYCIAYTREEIEQLF